MDVYREQTIKMIIKKLSESTNNESLRESPSRGAKQTQHATSEGILEQQKKLRKSDSLRALVDGLMVVHNSNRCAMRTDVKCTLKPGERGIGSLIFLIFPCFSHCFKKQGSECGCACLWSYKPQTQTRSLEWSKRTTVAQSDLCPWLPRVKRLRRCWHRRKWQEKSCQAQSGIRRDTGILSDRLRSQMRSRFRISCDFRSPLYVNGTILFKRRSSTNYSKTGHHLESSVSKAVEDQQWPRLWPPVTFFTSKDTSSSQTFYNLREEDGLHTYNGI